jgi:ribose 5-phosphate isomerase A
MSADQQKINAAAAAIDHVKPGSIIGVGTGSTVNHFIDLLGESMAGEILAAVSSSETSTERLIGHGIKVLNMNDCGNLDLYVDGADESNHQLHLIKGGGGALTREKIVAAASKIFVCIADESKLVDTLGIFPLPIEVIPMAREVVTRTLGDLGGNTKWREGFITDNGNHILDVSGISIADPIRFETTINQIAGVVTCGLFAHRPADVLILGLDAGHRSILAHQT